MKLFRLFSFTLLLTLSYKLSAGIISNTGLGGGFQVNHFEPIGQSFTAIDVNVEAGLGFWAMNAYVANDDQLRYRLYDGQGVTGSLLASSIFQLADSFSGLHLVDFSYIDLTIGNTYSLVVDVLGDSPYWGLSYGGALAGGVALRRFNGNDVLVGRDDMHIRVTGVTASTVAVSEPATSFLFISAFIGVMVFRRRVNKQN